VPTGDVLLLLSNAEFLEARLALVEDGQLDGARRLWAERSLIHDPPPDDRTLLHYRWRQLGAAAERFLGREQDADAYYRLARAWTDARWHREALGAAERALELDSAHTQAAELVRLLSKLDQFRRSLDSLAVAVYARADEGAIMDRELVVAANRFAEQLGYTFDVLLSRGLYLGQNPSPEHDSVWELELSVIVHHPPPTTISRPEGEMRLRHVLLDHDRLPRYHPERHPWTPRPGLVGRGAELGVYHDVDFYRRTGVALYRALERRAGAPPRRVADLGPAIIPLGEAGEAAREMGAGPLCTAGLADALRLRAVATTFGWARSQNVLRRNAMREFVTDLMQLRTRQLEAGLGRNYLDQLFYAELYGPARQEERRILEALASGPMPLWELARLVENACDPDELLVRTIASRAVLRALQRTLSLASPDDVLAVERGALRDAALTISIDLFGVSSGGG
jgi:hypothetical protein